MTKQKRIRMAKQKRERIKLGEAIIILTEEIDKTMQTRDYLIAYELTNSESIILTGHDVKGILIEICNILFGRGFELDLGDNNESYSTRGVGGVRASLRLKKK